MQLLCPFILLFRLHPFIPFLRLCAFIQDGTTAGLFGLFVTTSFYSSYKEHRYFYCFNLMITRWRLLCFEEENNTLTIILVGLYLLKTKSILSKLFFSESPDIYITLLLVDSGHCNTITCLPCFNFLINTKRKQIKKKCSFFHDFYQFILFLE